MTLAGIAQQAVGGDLGFSAADLTTHDHGRCLQNQFGIFRHSAHFYHGKSAVKQEGFHARQSADLHGDTFNGLRVMLLGNSNDLA
jgi:hypothetical protein